MFKVIGIVVLVIGVFIFFVYRDENKKAYSLRTARATNTKELDQTSSAIASEIGGGDWRDYVKIWGKITSDKPLISELKEEPCVYYQMKVIHKYQEKVREKDVNGAWVEKMQDKQEVVAEHQRAIPFTLQDKWGEITVNPDEAELDLIQVVDEFHPEVAVGNMIAYGQFSLVLKKQPSNHPRQTLGFQYQELILPVEQNVLVAGTASDETGELVMVNPIHPQQKFIISRKTYEALTKETDQTAKMALITSIVCSVIGVLLIIFG